METILGTDSSEEADEVDNMDIAIDEVESTPTQVQVTKGCQVYRHFQVSSGMIHCGVHHNPKSISKHYDRVEPT
eukprot:SAG11_NODE_17356_length_521_cov_0.592417_1_plen_73_part_10